MENTNAKPDLAVIKPKEYKNPMMRKQLYACVDEATNHESPVIGYGVVSIHEDGSFRAYCLPPAGVQVMDMPEMMKTRMNAIIVSNLKGSK